MKRQNNCGRRLPMVFSVAASLLLAACGKSYVLNPSALPHLAQQAEQMLLVSDVQYDTRVVPANVTAFMEAYSRSLASAWNESGAVAEVGLERDLPAGKLHREGMLIRYRVTDFVEAVDCGFLCHLFFGKPTNIIELKVNMKLYHVAAETVTPARVVEGSQMAPTSMIDISGATPLCSETYGVRVVGKLGAGDQGTERIAFSRAMAQELAYQTVRKSYLDIKAVLR